MYLDESEEKIPHLQKRFVVSALCVPEYTWLETFRQIKEFRHRLKIDYGIFIRKELHATDFLVGRGVISDRMVTKYERSFIYQNSLLLLNSMDWLSVINVSLTPIEGRVLEYEAIERMFNRIHRAVIELDDYALLIFDEGKEKQITKIARKMHVFNKIPSMYGSWQNGSRSKNITIDRILEDPFFKPSASSYFIQLVDFIAYSLLRHDNPTTRIKEYGLHKAFYLLSDILNTKASRYDDFGVVRK
ncbi:MAG TPA: DUF3800 domain-containing protein [bacterium]|nr:DUF3800 domain-containing protein [bacterium]